ncbi:hypothetical protein ACFLXI_03400 [Chloroflexota bacterium]
MNSTEKQRKEVIHLLYAMMNELEPKERQPNLVFPFNLLVYLVRLLLQTLETLVGIIVLATLKKISIPGDETNQN